MVLSCQASVVHGATLEETAGFLCRAGTPLDGEQGERASADLAAGRTKAQGPVMPERRFSPPWLIDDPDMKLGQDCYIVRDANGHRLAYVYFEDEPRRRSAAHLMTRDEARRSPSTSPSCRRCTT
jgi:hypothetical protein